MSEDFEELPVDGQGLMTIEEAAARVAVSPITVRTWIKRHGLKRVQWKGRLWLIEADVLECERARRSSGRAHQRRAAKGRGRLS